MATRSPAALVALSCVLVAVWPRGAGAQSSGTSSRGAPSGLAQLLERALAARGSMPPRWPRTPTLDLATSMSGLAELERIGRTGEGAAVCVVDGGVDVMHHDFRDRDGRSRALFVLDLGAAPRGVHGALEASCECAVYSGADVDAGALARPLDPSGHGTAVASAALGDGAGMGEAVGPLGGAAPGASLIAVRLPPAFEGARGFTDDAIVRGVTACFDAGPPGRTVVVVALGGHDGQHDGGEPIDRALSELAETRGPIVVSAGNDGGSPTHAWGRLRPGDSAEVDVLVPMPEAGIFERHVALSATIAFGQAIFVQTPDGSSLGPVREGERAWLAHAGGEVFVDATLGASDDGPRSVYVLLGPDEPTFTELAGGTYRLRIAGEGRFDAWLVGVDIGDTLVPVALGGAFVDPESVVSVPGTARSVITVGATVARPRLDTDAGELTVGGEPGEVAWFSSRGPTIDGRPKPDLVAPGAALAVALSGDVGPSTPLGTAPARIDRLRIGMDRIAAAGTSLAAPLVAGAIAIAIADEPWRFASDVDVLRLTARPVAAAPWDEAGGFGALDALAFVRSRESGALATDVDVATSGVVGTAPIEVGAPRAWIAGRILGASGPWSGELLLLAPDASVTTIPVAAGVVSAPIPAPRIGVGQSIELGVYAGTTRLPSIRFRARWDGARERTPPEPRGGGAQCAAMPVPRRTGVPAWPLLVGVAYSIRIALRRRVTSRASTSS